LHESNVSTRWSVYLYWILLWRYVEEKKTQKVCGNNVRGIRSKISVSIAFRFSFKFFSLDALYVRFWGNGLSNTWRCAVWWVKNWNIKFWMKTWKFLVKNFSGHKKLLNMLNVFLSSISDTKNLVIKFFKFTTYKNFYKTLINALHCRISTAVRCKNASQPS
jgi:hypothetical protein